MLTDNMRAHIRLRVRVVIQYKKREAGLGPRKEPGSHWHLERFGMGATELPRFWVCWPTMSGNLFFKEN